MAARRPIASRAPRRLAFGVAIVAALVLVAVLADALREALADRAATAVAAIGTARIESLLGPRDFDALGGAIAPDFGVTGAPAVVLSAGGALRVVDELSAAQPRLRSVEVAGTQPESLALDRDGTMLAVADGYFGFLDREGRVVHGLPLPYAGMRLAPSVHRGAVYLFGGAGKDYRLYRFIDDGTLQVLLESAAPIVAAADDARTIYAATPSLVLRLKSGTPDILFRAPAADFDGPIRSLAVTPDGVVLFSTQTKVYALLGPNALSIVNDAGGALRLRDGRLYVLDPRRQLLFSLAPASLELFKGALR